MTKEVPFEHINPDSLISDIYGNRVETPTEALSPVQPQGEELEIDVLPTMPQEDQDFLIELFKQAKADREQDLQTSKEQTPPDELLEP